MTMRTKWKRVEIGAGDLRTPVKFLEYVPNDGPEPGDDMKKVLYACTALIYSPSMKDMEIMNTKGTKEGVTIKIRDPHQDYQPTNKHKVEIDDFRYKDKVWEIIDVSPDFENNSFIKVILGVTS